MRKQHGTHGVEVRSQVRELRRAVPFRPFALTMKDGKVVRVRQWLNICFDPGDAPRRRGSLGFTVISDNGAYDGSFEDVATITLIENGDADDSGPAGSRR